MNKNISNVIVHSQSRWVQSSGLTKGLRQEDSRYRGMKEGKDERTCHHGIWKVFHRGPVAA